MCQVVINIGNPPSKGACEVCGAKTEAWDKRWTQLCPKHWLEVWKRAA
jgi:hypothetical protein